MDILKGPIKVKNMYISLIVGIILMLGLLTGCVAPEGMRYQLERPSDGVNVASSEATGNGETFVPLIDTPNSDIAYPPRPILYIPSWHDNFIHGIYPDGRKLDLAAPGMLLGWSRQGDRFAYLAIDESTRTAALVVTELDGEPVRIMEVTENSSPFTYGWQSIWSPDGTQLALLLSTAEQISLAVVAVQSREILQNVALSIDIYSRDGYSSNWPPYTLKWSPDGEKILLAWEQTIVLHTNTGEIEVLVPQPTMAEWLPDSENIVFYPILHATTLYRRALGSDSFITLLELPQLEEWGVEGALFLYARLLKLSPSGRYLAMLSMGEQGSVILIFDMEQATDVVWSTPPGLHFIDDGLVMGLEWGPDEQEVALLHMAELAIQIYVLELESGAKRTLIELPELRYSTQIDVVGLVNVMSWTP